MTLDLLRREFMVKGERPNGQTVTIRRGFTSQEAAEDYPVKMSDWRKVWVEPLKKPATNRGMPIRDPAKWKAAAYTEVLAAALVGDRCPFNGVGHVSAQTLGVLAREGKIRIEISGQNWRVVTIMEGPHAGKSTMRAPSASGPPYVVIGKGGRQARRI